MGDEAEDILISTNISSDDKKAMRAFWENLTTILRSAKTSFLKGLDLIAGTNSKESQQNSI